MQRVSVDIIGNLFGEQQSAEDRVRLEWKRF